LASFKLLIAVQDRKKNILPQSRKRKEGEALKNLFAKSGLIPRRKFCALALFAPMPLELIILQSTLIFITRLYYAFPAFVHEALRLKRAKVAA
jgi:hypothetical protein